VSYDIDDLGILLPSTLNLISKLIDNVVQTGYVRQVGCVEISDGYGDICYGNH